MRPPRPCWWPRDNVDLSLGVAYAWLRNAGNVSGPDENRWSTRIGVRLRK